jgi:heptose-I-phosphate ethanolaminephosphotransferase
MARYEYEIPFWIYMSPSYKEAHPDVVWQVEQALHKPFMTDALAHMLVYLGGIHTKSYRRELNLLSIKYDEARKRILKDKTDYDAVINGEKEKMKK